MCFASILRQWRKMIQLLLNKTTTIFSFYLYLRLTSHNSAFIRRRLYSKRKVKEYMSCDMRLSTMWYVRPANAKTSLGIRAVIPEPFLVA